MTPTAADADLLRRLAEPSASIASVARDLKITEAAVAMRLHRLYRRLGVNSALQAWVKLRLS